MYTKKDTQEAKKIFESMSKKQLVEIALDYREGYFRMLDLYESAQHRAQPTGGNVRQKAASNRKAATIKKVGSPTSG